MMKRLIAAPTLTVALALTMTACNSGGSSASGPSMTTVPTASGVGTTSAAGAGSVGGPSATSSGAGQTSAPSGPVTSTARPAPATSAAPARNLPAGVFPGAGGPRPAGARALGVGYVQTPSTNNACTFGQGADRCVAFGHPVQVSTGADVAHYTAIDLATMQVMAAEIGDVGASGSPVLNYGESGYYGDYVVGSTTSGMTVWNVKTGHGALINTSGISTF